MTIAVITEDYRAIFHTLIGHSFSHWTQDQAMFRTKYQSLKLKTLFSKHEYIILFCSRIKKVICFDVRQLETQKIAFKISDAITFT